MRLASTVAAVAIVVAGSTPALAQPAAGVQPSPYGSLFAKAPKLSPSPLHFPALTQASPAPQIGKPTVICGLTLVPGDPTIDPAFQRPAPAGGPWFAMRKVEPRTCR